MRGIWRENVIDSPCDSYFAVLYVYHRSKDKEITTELDMVNRYKVRWQECGTVRDHFTQPSKFIRVILRFGTYY